MAYVQDQNDPNAPPATATSGAAMNQLPQTSSGTGAGATTVNTSSGGSPQGAAAVPNATQAPPVQNLGAYLAANQPQAVQMGQNIANNLTTQSNQVTGDINADQAAVDQQVQASNVQPNSQLITEAASNPAQFVENPTNVTQFEDLANANYTGPTAFEQTPQYQTLTNEVTNAQQNAPNVNTPAGIQQLVTGQETNPTLGEENLDALLLEGTPGAVAPISAAEAPIQNLATELSNAAGTEDQNIAQAVANDQVAPEAIQSAFLTGPNAVVPAFQNTIDTDAANAQAAINNYNSELGNDINQVSPLLQQANTFGAQTGVGFGDVNNPYQISDEITGTANPANTATPEQYAEEAALQQLLGGNLSLPINQSTVSQAGTVPTIPTLSNLGETGLAQEYINSLINQGASAGVNEIPGITNGTGLIQTQPEVNQGPLSPKQQDLITLANYLQSIDPSSVVTEPATVSGNGVTLNNPFSGWLELINNAVG